MTVALDSSGVAAHYASSYYVWRRRTAGGGGWGVTPARQRWPKLQLMADVETHLILSMGPQFGPTHDAPAFAALLACAAATLPRAVQVACLLADAGYDAEHNLALAHRQYAIPRVVVALNRGAYPTRLPHGRYRRALARRFPRARYRHRAQIESVFSRFKRRLGGALTARRPAAQMRELMLRVLTHNLMLLRAVARRIQQSQRHRGTETSAETTHRQSPRAAVS